MRRVLPGRFQRLNWRGGGETAAAAKPQLRGSAHLSLLPGPKWTGSLTCRGAPALTAPRWGANLPHPRRVGLWACESHLSPRARPDPFLPGFPQSRGRPRRPAASLPGGSAQAAPSRRQYEVPRTPRSWEPGARKPRPRRPRPAPPHSLRPRPTRSAPARFCPQRPVPTSPAEVLSLEAGVGCARVPAAATQLEFQVSRWSVPGVPERGAGTP